MDFGSLLRETWNRYIREIVSLVLFTLLGVALCFTIILIPTVASGWMRGMLEYVREGHPPRLEELWSFEDYLQTLLLIVISGVLIVIGYALLIVPGVILHVWWLYALLFLVDEKLGFAEALRESRKAVVRTGFFNHLVVLLICAVLGSIGSSFSGLGALLTTPFALLLLALAYEEVSQEEVEAP